MKTRNHQNKKFADSTGARKQIEVYRKMSGMQRLQIAFQLYDLAHEIVSSSVKQMFPNISDAELQIKVKERMSHGTS